MIEEEISAAVQQSVAAANALGANDLEFHRSLDTDLSKSLDETLKQILSLTTTLLKFADPEKGAQIELNDSEDVDARWGDIIDVVDSLLEHTDDALESLDAPKKEEAPRTEKIEKEPLPANLRNAQDLPHPQLKFKRKVDNSDEPWTPILTTKPNAKVSLDKSSNEHPYSHEIKNIKYPEFVYKHREPIPYHDVATTTATWVETKEQLDEMLAALRKSTEIAIDLEHHDFHSYRGFVCLMQVSNRDQDWIVDTLALRDDLVVLNEVFTDEAILKVFHGANWDIIWLQRDLGLYIVNLFDTYHASRALGLEGHGLAFLLQKYVNFDADKRYQLADWRIRPLPKEMLYYARSDTHYLLYIYDLMRNALIEKGQIGNQNALESVMHASAEVSLRTYSKEPYDAAEGRGTDGWQILLNKFYATRSFNPQQLEVMKALHQWRDQTSRKIDESTRYVMPSSSIVNIASALPKDLNSLLKANKQTSSTMQAHSKEILKIIKKAIKYADKQSQLQLDTSNKEVDLSTIDTFTQPHSTFWGGLSDSLKFTPTPPVLDIQLTVPMVDIKDELYTEEVDTPEEIIEEAPPEVFIVQDLKRKSEAIEPTDAAKAAKAARKAAKKAKKEAEKVVKPDEEEEEPFDYAAQQPLVKEPTMKRQKPRKFDEFKGKIVRSRPIKGGARQSTFPSK